MANYLIENDFLAKNDIIGFGNSILADGTIKEHVKINLRDVEIEGFHIYDIEANVIKGQNAPLLLGLSAIQAIGKVTIDKDKLIIHSQSNEYTEEMIIELLIKANDYFQTKSFAAAIDCFVTVKNNWGLSGIGLKRLAFCLFLDHRHQQCIETCNEWIIEHESSSNDVDVRDIYDYLAGSFSRIEDYQQALKWYQKSLYLNVSLKDTAALCSNYDNIAFCLVSLNRVMESKEYYKNAIKCECSRAKCTIDDIKAGKIKNESIGMILFGYSMACHNIHDDDNSDQLLIMAAKCGYQGAITLCKKFGLDYSAKTEIFD